MSEVRFGRFLTRVTACHLVTYFAVGVIAYFVLDYATSLQSGSWSGYIRPMSSKWVAAGPALNVFRGLIFALALYPFRKVFLEEPRGWLKLWGLLVGLSILSTAGAAPGSVEGLIYTTTPALTQIMGLREVVAQTLAFSVLVVAWHRRPHPAWGIVMGILSFLVILVSIAGVLLPRPAAFQ